MWTATNIPRGTLASLALDEGGDIIFNTDANFRDEDLKEWFDAKRKSVGVTCHGVGVRNDINALKPWCDTVTVAEALDETESKEVLQWCK